MTVQEAIDQLDTEGLTFLLTGEITGSFPNNGRHQCSRLGLVDSFGLTPAGLIVQTRLALHK